MLSAQSWIWGRESKELNPGSQYEPWAVATDGQKNAYVTGFGFGEIIFGTDTIDSYPNTMFLAKYDSSGNIQWLTNPVQKDGNDNAYSSAVTTDNNGNVYVAGGFSDTVSFGSYRLIANMPIGSECPYIVKYSPGGNVLWAIQAISPSSTSMGGINSIAIDASGNIYATGSFYDTLSFGLTTLIANRYNGVFTVKYDANGNVIWAQQSQTTNGHYCTGVGNSITTDLTGNVYVTGSYMDSIYFGPYKLTDGAKSNLFLVKYSSGGNVLFATQPLVKYSTYSVNYGTSVTTDNAGNIYITGDYEDTLVLGSHILTTMANSKKVPYAETFLAKYAPDGTIIWAKQSQYENGLDFGNGYTIPMIVSDKKNDIFMELLADTSNFTFGGYTFTIPASSKEEMRLGTVCIAKLDTSGKVSCASVYANSFNAFVNSGPGYFPTNIGICADDSGKYIYITEDNYEDTLVFGQDSLIALDDYLPFVARWQPCEPSNSGGGGGGGGGGTNPPPNPTPKGDCHNLFVPDVFTPDGAYNNIFYVRGECIQSLDKFLVFDRWGNKIFESKNLNDGWNGNWGGHPMSTGTYIWYAKVTFQDGTTTEVKGNVTLLR